MTTARAYQLLQIAPTGDPEAIRAAFKRLAAIYHPDRHVASPPIVRAEARRRMMDISQAFAILRAQAGADVIVGRHRRDDDSVQAARDARTALGILRIEREKAAARHRRWDELERQARAWVHAGSDRTEHASGARASD